MIHFQTVIMILLRENVVIYYVRKKYMIIVKDVIEIIHVLNVIIKHIMERVVILHVLIVLE